MIEVLSRTIKDGRVISLIHKYLNAGVISRGIFEKTRTKYKRLRALGMEEKQVHRHANNRHGVWYCSGLQYLNYALNNTKPRDYGYPTFTEFYLKICEN